MIKFNDTSILTGYIKQKLHSFNLPTVDVVSDEEVESDLFVEGALYIKDNSFKLYSGGEFKDTQYLAYRNLTTGELKTKTTNFIYYEDRSYPLFTKNLEIKNNRYDSYTHTYLGEYLRFLRDYYGLNLMSLYNCFSNEITSNLNIKETNNEGKVLWSFDSSDSRYTIYAIPVKFNKTYTIAIDSSLGVELVCGFYDKVQDNREDWKDLYSKTHIKKSCTYFNEPFTYTVSHSGTSFDRLEQVNQSNLKLFIKVPFSNESSIVILEGNYLNYNDSFLQQKDTNDGSLTQYLVRHQNHTVFNCDSDSNLSKFNPISSLQLLRINSGVSYPFADRLVEYLLEQAITSIDSIDKNIERVQKILLLRNEIKPEIEANYKINGNWSSLYKLDENKYYKEWYDRYKDDPDFIMFFKDFKPVVGIPRIDFEGSWQDLYRVAIYDLAVQEKLIDEYNDFLGYVDKDIETKLKADYEICVPSESAKEGKAVFESKIETIDTIVKEEY